MFFKHRHNKMDKLGMGVSIACAIHCALLPVIITTLPLLGIGFLANSYFETSIIITSLIIGYASLTKSFCKHNRTTPLVIITIGFGIIFIGKFLADHSQEWLFLALGGLIIASAHYYNSRLYSRHCQQS
ncbi:MerC domain-containing protein [Mucilaginibacter agri]|uniref:MerC family mercury resistance protein n=1 Tax=Mucilaginibacter agri TaxID=2695265 RepID=A0A966DV29_9SPHI|nr:MerC domain-containing protein [Mucilaginibacter agri]NCD71066.1 MerC family mercury resistance protein [Mucilaginibacter agri]